MSPEMWLVGKVVPTSDACKPEVDLTARSGSCHLVYRYRTSQLMLFSGPPRASLGVSRVVGASRAGEPGRIVRDIRDRWLASGGA